MTLSWLEAVARAMTRVSRRQVRVAAQVRVDEVQSQSSETLTTVRCDGSVSNDIVRRGYILQLECRIFHLVAILRVVELQEAVGRDTQ